MVIRNKAAALALYILVFFVFWNLVDYMCVTFLAHSTFTFTAFGSAVLPLAVALTTGYYSVYRDQN